MANRYWVGGTGTWNTSSTTNWSASTGGSTGASVPGTGDAVFFDQAATYTVTMTGALNCLDITVSAGTVTFATGTSPTLTVYGNMSLVAATVWSSTGNVTFNATTTGKTITTNAVTLTPNVLFNGSGGAWTLGSALTLGLTSTANLANGTLDLGGFTFTTGIFNSIVSTTRALSFSSAGNIALAHTTAAQTVLSLLAPNLTVTGTGGFTSVMSVTRRFASSTGPYTGAQPNLTLSSGASNFTIDANSYFNVIDFGTCTGNILSANPVYMSSLVLSSGGTFTSLLATMRDTGNITTNGKSIGTLTINSAGTTTFLGNVSATTYTQTAGNVNFATYSLTATGNITVTSGALSNAGNISGANWNVTGNLDITSGNFTASTAFIFNSAAGTLNINGGTLTANSAFTHTAGTVILGTNANFSSTSTYNFTAGTITLANNTLTVGVFSTTGSNARTIAFGTGNIALTNTTANTTVLSAAAVTNLTCTGTGGFTSIMSTPRTFTGGSTGAPTNANLYNLFITSGTSNVTFTNNSYYKSIDFSGSNCALAAATSVQTQSLTLSSSSGANFTLLSVVMRGGGTIRGNTKSLANLTINNANLLQDTTLADAVTCANFIMATGNLDFATFSMTATSNANYTAGNMSNIGSISSGNYFLGFASALTFTQGNLNVTSNFELANGTGTFTYSGGNLNITGNLVQYSTGNFNLTQAMTLPSTCTYDIKGGNLNLNNNILTTGRFTSTGTANARNINFGTANIVLNGTGTVLSWSGSDTNTYTGSGIFTTDATVARTFSATSSNYSMAVSLVFTGTGSVAPTAFTSAVYKSIDFGNVSFALPASVISAETIVLSPSANYNALGRFETYGTGTFNPNTNPTVKIIYFGSTPATFPAGTTTLSGNLSANGTVSLYSGNLNFNNYNIISANNGIFSYNSTDGGKLLNVGNLTAGKLIVGNTASGNCTLELDSGNIIIDSLQAQYSSNINYRTGANISVLSNLMLGRSIGGFLSGNLTLYKDLTMANTGSNGYTLGVAIFGGTLNLNGYTLTTTSITDSAETGTGNTLIRGLNFGSGGNIIMPYSTSGMSLGGFSAANFTLSGTGNVTALASATSTWVANSANLAYNLTLTGSGNATNNCTIYTNSYFTNLDISNVTSVVSYLGSVTNVFVKTASLPTSANTINVFLTTYDTGTITSGGATLGRLNIAPPSGTTTLLSNITINTGGVVYLNTGNLNLNNFNITTSQLLSTALANNRSINFGSGNIIINNGSGNGLGIANAINFTSTGTGGFVYTGTTARTWSFGNAASGLSNNAPSLKFIGASMANQTVGTNSWFNVLDFGNTAMSLNNNNVATTLNVNGLILSSGGAFSNLTANIVGTGNIDGNSKTIPQLIINHSGNTTFTGSLTTTSNVTLTSGNVNLGGYTLTPNEFISGTSATRNITGPGTIAVANNWTVTDGTGFTGSNYTINMSKATSKTFTGANGTYGTLVQAGAGNLTIVGSNQFDNITANTRPSTITFTAGTTQTVLSFTASGNAGNVVTLNSTSAGTIYYLRNYVGTGNSSYLNLSDSNVTAAFFANTNSTDSGNNTGWNFAAPPTVQSGFNAFF